jgi:multidrug resistance efflux pump
MDTDKRVSHIATYKRPWWKGANQWWPLLVFVGFLFLAVFLHSKGGQYRVLTGTAERVIERIAPLESARVISVAVEVGDIVKAGDVIAQLDTSIIDAESAVLKERIMQARLEAKLEQLTLERQFEKARQDAEQALRQAELEFKVNQIEHRALAKEVERMEPLLEQQLIDAGVLASMKSRETVLREILKLGPENINVLQAQVQHAKDQQDAALLRLNDINEFTSATMEEEAVTLINIRRDGYTLRAQQDGVIADVEHRAGDVVDSGEAIASVLLDGPVRIVGFLTEGNLSDIQVGTAAKIYPSVSIRTSGIIPAHVTQVSPAVYSLPDRASPVRGQVVRGRRVTFELDEQRALVPGETVSIEIRSGSVDQSLGDI